MKGIKRKGEGKWKKVAIFIALTLVFGVLSNSVYKVYHKRKEAGKALSQAKEELTELESREQFLGQTLERLETEEGIEFEIRRRLNVAGAGESVAIIVEEGQNASTPPPQKSFWQKTKDFFGGLFE